MVSLWRLNMNSLSALSVAAEEGALEDFWARLSYDDAGACSFFFFLPWRKVGVEEEGEEEEAVGGGERVREGRRVKPVEGEKRRERARVGTERRMEREEGGGREGGGERWVVWGRGCLLAGRV